jgi:hypothetical protein
VSDARITSLEIVPPDGAADAEEVPRRRHRRFQPWADFELSPKELAAETRIYPVRVLVHALASDATFVSALEDGTSEDDLDRLARRYVRRDGRPRRVFRWIIERAATSSAHDPRFQLVGLRVSAVFPDEPLSEHDPDEWTHAKHYRTAAAMLVRLGARRCLYCGVPLARDGSRRRYCSAHAARALGRERADRELIVGLLRAAGDALGIP